jgi:hypothetical protein
MVTRTSIAAAGFKISFMMKVFDDEESITHQNYFYKKRCISKCARTTAYWCRILKCGDSRDDGRKSISATIKCVRRNLGYICLFPALLLRSAV